MIQPSDLPEGWSVVPLRRVLRKLARPVPSGSEIVTAYRDGTVTLRSAKRGEGYTLSDVEAGYQGVMPGDLVFHALDGFAGAVGVSDSAGRCTPVYHVCEPALGDDSAVFGLCGSCNGVIRFSRSAGWDCSATICRL